MYVVRAADVSTFRLLSILPETALYETHFAKDIGGGRSGEGNPIRGQFRTSWLYIERSVVFDVYLGEVGFRSRVSVPF